MIACLNDCSISSDCNHHRSNLEHLRNGFGQTGRGTVKKKVELFDKSTLEIKKSNRLTDILKKNDSKNKTSEAGNKKRKQDPKSQSNSSKKMTVSTSVQAPMLSTETHSTQGQGSTERTNIAPTNSTGATLKNPTKNQKKRKK